MPELSFISQMTLYMLLLLIGFFALLIWVWQYRVLGGKSLKNPDRSSDDWHGQKTHYGLAFADVFLACPATIIGIILIFIIPRWGYYILALTSFWLIWASLMTTSTSLRFENPKISLTWFVTFPLGAIVGFAYILWTFINFEVIFQ